ncbi:MAG: hypothetical protein JWN84_1597 [Nocardioides sp.]|nr:hypothetical protein [Nocardioides sp.]
MLNGGCYSITLKRGDTIIGLLDNEGETGATITTRTATDITVDVDCGIAVVNAKVTYLETPSPLVTAGN